MFKISELFKSLKMILKNVRLVDKCLIIFMVIFMGQTIYNLFINESISQNSNLLDVVVRTTSASIFGYFISGNFLNRNKNKENICPKQVDFLDKESLFLSNDSKVNSEYNRLQSIEEIGEKETFGEAYENNISPKEINNQQIIIVTIIGIVSAIVLIIDRNCNYSTTYALGSLSQLRDFVSGCVGFLLGYQTKKS